MLPVLREEMVKCDLATNSRNFEKLVQQPLLTLMVILLEETDLTKRRNISELCDVDKSDECQLGLGIRLG